MFTHTFIVPSLVYQYLVIMIYIYEIEVLVGVYSKFSASGLWPRLRLMKMVSKMPEAYWAIILQCLSKYDLRWQHFSLKLTSVACGSLFEVADQSFTSSCNFDVQRPVFPEAVSQAGVVNVFGWLIQWRSSTKLHIKLSHVLLCCMAFFVNYFLSIDWSCCIT